MHRLQIAVSLITPLIRRSPRLGPRTTSGWVYGERDGPSKNQYTTLGPSGPSSTYEQGMHEAWKIDPNSVHKSWDVYFRSLANDPGPVSKIDKIDKKEVANHLSLELLVRNYQVLGHKCANLDPLAIKDISTDRKKFLDLSQHKFSEADLDQKFYLPRSTYIGDPDTPLTLKEIIQRLEYAYCSSIGVEYMFINNKRERDWIRTKFETRPEVEEQDKITILERLIRSTRFESFLAKKWASEKRFGLEGCEVLIPALKTIIDECCEKGVNYFAIGMPHRGRLNVLANVCRKPLHKVLSQFNPDLEPSDEGSGDVKYHLGLCHERLNRKTNKKIRLAVVANPSHLEAVNTVVMGKVRSEQQKRGDKEGESAMCLLLHGDAAFAGQGVVYEGMHLGELPAYTVHGTIHIVVNNQIGFTTDPRFSRSSPYCTDVARVVNCPIFHVNGDDPEAVMYVCQVASAWRKEFKKDVVIDLISYRRYGHNEVDNPRFTQPIMYKKIDKLCTVETKYAEKLINEKIMTQQKFEETIHEYEQILEDGLKLSHDEGAPSPEEWLDSPWTDFYSENRNALHYASTGITEDRVKHILTHVSSIPDRTDQSNSKEKKKVNIHSGIARILNNRRKLMEERMVDWAGGEFLAFGSLLMDGYHCRLSGQDVERGTFSHRHFVLHDQIEDKTFGVPLTTLSPDQAKFTVCNSPLSEYGVLGFETGYCTNDPNFLTIWEAQFGDFANGAQTMIDQFISSGQDKWTRQNGVVLLLPHGYDGMGPEHSSARLERFLQLCNDDEDEFPDTEDKDFVIKQLKEINWFVCNFTTSANLFHGLRRQILLPFRKPLIVMSPKSLLRSQEAQSPFEDFIGDTYLQRAIPENGEAAQNPEKVQKLIFCSGKIYYELVKNRKSRMLDQDIAISRIEQISPFPFDLVKKEMLKYPNADICWTQEEHKNMGAWDYVQPRMRTVLSKIGKPHEEISYAGRGASAATADGSMNRHKRELSILMEAAMKL